MASTESTSFTTKPKIRRKDNVPASDIRSSDSQYPRRDEMVGNDFFFRGASDLAKGKFQVSEILEDKNLYRCTRLTGDGPQMVEDSTSLGYVIKEYMKAVDKRRELGVGEVLSTQRTCGR